MDIFQSTMVFIFIIGTLTLFLRKNIANIFSRIPIPKFALFLMVGMIYSTIEENINCPGNDCSNILPLTLVVFFGLLLIHLVILNVFKIKDFRLGVLILGIMGWVTEFLLGASMGILWSSPFITIVMTFWVILTYSIIAIVPVTILLDKPRKQFQNRTNLLL